MYYNCVVVIRFALILYYVASVANADCVIDPFDDNCPLVLTRRNSSILYPDYGEKELKFRKGETIEFECPGNNNEINGFSSQKTIEAKCLSKKQFQIFGEPYAWTDISCRFSPNSTIRYTNSNCAVDSRFIEIGFDLDNGRFISTMTICFNTSSLIALYSRYDITAAIQSNVVNNSRPSFFEDRDLYNLKDRVDTCYTKNRQRFTVNNLLGLPPSSLSYTGNGDLFLSRGHLAAKSDFVYGFQQNATFRFINAAPQWQIFNGGNWNHAEQSTRNYADRRKANLNIWTGTYGIATLPHQATQQATELYLYVNGKTKALPVPGIYWKMVYNPSNKRCVVLIGLNNPFEENIQKNIICNDISNGLNWLSWEKTNLRKGYLYACTCLDFKMKVEYAPLLSVSGILN